MAEQIVIAELQINTKSLQDSSAKLVQDIAKLKAEQKDLTKVTAGLTQATDEQSLRYIENDAKLKQLNSEYANNKKVLAETISGVEGLNDLLSEEVKTVGDAEKANKKLSLIRSQITTDTQEGRDAIEEINAKLDENNDFIKGNSDQLKQQKINVGNYKESIKEAFGELNIFNGGLGGFMQRSKEAGGVGPLVKSSFMSISSGINAATKSAWGFVANPIGAILAAIVIVLGILWGVFKSFTPVVDKCEQVMAALGAVVNVLKNSVIALVTGTKSLGEVFTTLGGSMADAADQAAKLKKAQQDLEDQQGALEIAEAKANRQINEALLKSKDRTLTEEQRIAFLQKAQKIENDIYNEKKKHVDEELRQAQEKLIIGTGLTQDEIKQLREKGFEYAKILQDKYALDDEDIDKLKDALIKKENILNDSISIQEKAQNKVNALYEKADEEREKAQEKAKKAQEDAVQRDKENKDKLIERMNQELNLFVAKENLKIKSVQQSVVYEQQYSQMRIDILEKEYAFGKKSKLQYDAEIIQITQDTSLKLNELILNRSKAELELYISQNVTKLDATKLLNQSIIDEEAKRLESIKLDKLNIVEQEKQTNQEIIDLKVANNEQLSVADIEYLTAKNNLEAEFRNQNKANQDAFDEQVKQQKAEQLIADREIELGNAQTKFEEDMIIAQQQYDVEVEMFAEKLKKQLLTQEQYDAKVALSDKKKKEMMRIAELNDTQSKLNEYKKLGEGLAGLFGKNKLIASALAGVNTALGVTEILKTPSVLPEPAASISRAIQVGTTIATGIKAVAEINGAKFAKGIVNIDGPGTSTSDSIPSLLSRGESVIKADATAKYPDILEAMNNDTFSRDYATPFVSTSTIAGFQGSSFKNQNLSIDLDLLATKIGIAVVEGNKTLPPPELSLVEFHKSNNSYNDIINGANH